MPAGLLEDYSTSNCPSVLFVCVLLSRRCILERVICLAGKLKDSLRATQSYSNDKVYMKDLYNRYLILYQEKTCEEENLL